MRDERFTLDTNVLIYSVDSEGGVRREIAREIIERAVFRDCWLTLQCLSEFYAAATRKRRMPASEAAAQAADWMDVFRCMPASSGAVRAALTQAAAGQAAYWDALLVATAAEGGCTTILTEDMADGESLGAVRVLNPFGPDAMTVDALGLLA